MTIVEMLEWHRELVGFAYTYVSRNRECIKAGAHLWGDVGASGTGIYLTGARDGLVMYAQREPIVAVIPWDAVPPELNLEQ